MASIIQIKHGSGSKEPVNSQLSNAELAINIDTGQLWYGSGSAGNEVTQSKIKFNEVSASSATGSFTGSFLGTFTSADIVALKLESASLLSYTASNNASITSFKLETASLHTNTASVAASITSFKLETASLHTFTSSFTGTTFASLLTNTASVNAQTASLLTQTASVAASITSFKLETASLHTNTASLNASVVSFKLETASLHTFTASGFQSPLSMSVGATLSNTTNVAGTPLYVHGNISASGQIVADTLKGTIITPGNQPNIISLGTLEGLASTGEVDFSLVDSLNLGTNSSAEKITIKSASIGTTLSNTTNPSGTQLYVHGKISASTAIITKDIIAARHISGGFSLSINSASIGTPPTNTTNIAGTPLYVHGAVSASGEIEGASLTAAIISGSNTLSGLTASFGTRTDQTTNPAGITLYVHGASSASGNVFGRNIITSGYISASGATMASTASFGAPASVTTNVAGTPLYVHGNVSASGNVYSANEKTIFISAYLKSTRMDKWWGPKKFGTGFYQWNQSHSSPGGDMSRLFSSTGFPIPEKAKYVGFQVSATLGGGTADMPITASFSIVESMLDNYVSANQTLIHFDSGSSVTDAGGGNYDTVQINSTTAAGTTIPKNSMIFPRFAWGTDQTAANITNNEDELFIILQFKYIPIP